MDVTPQVERIVRDSEIRSGTCLVFVPHTTAGVIINENADPAVKVDLLEILGALVPRSRKYRHGEGNSDAHAKASLVGSSVSVVVRDGCLLLGTWQGVTFCEFDGPRRRRVVVQVQGEGG
ncbi:MAG: secondary thiamine-phosphate synthase enzyme YjbQ [Promethearchaeota archaeon]